jgi:hypothetical protein
MMAADDMDPVATLRLAINDVHVTAGNPGCLSLSTTSGAHVSGCGARQVSAAARHHVVRAMRRDEEEQESAALLQQPAAARASIAETTVGSSIAETTVTVVRAPSEVISPPAHQRVGR